MGSIRSFPAFFSPISKQVLAVTSSPAVALTVPAAPPQVRSVIFTAEAATAGDKCRFWVDGSTPDANNGMLLFDGDIVELDNVEMIKNFKIIALASTFTLQIEYFGGGC